MNPANKPAATRRAWFAWALPLVGHVCVLSAIFWFLSGKANLLLVSGLLLLGIALLIVSFVAIAAIFSRWPKHGWCGIAVLLLAGPLMFLVLYFGVFPQSRQNVAQQWRQWRRHRAIASEFAGQKLTYQEVQLPTLSIPDKLVIGEESSDAMRVSAFDVPRELRQGSTIFGAWSADGAYVYIYAIAPEPQLWQIDAARREVKARVSLQSFIDPTTKGSLGNLALTSVGPVIQYERDMGCRLVLLDPSDLSRGKEIARLADKGVVMSDPQSPLVVMRRGMGEIPVLDLESMTLKRHVPHDTFRVPDDPHRFEYLEIQERPRPAFSVGAPRPREINLYSQSLRTILQKLIPKDVYSGDTDHQLSFDRRHCLSRYGQAWVLLEVVAEDQAP